MRALATHGDPVQLERLRVLLKRLGFKVVWTCESHRGTVTSLDVARRALFKFDVVVLADDAQPGLDGLVVLQHLRMSGDMTPVVVLGGDPFDRKSWPSNSALIEDGGHVDVIEQAIRELVPGVTA